MSSESGNGGSPRGDQADLQQTQESTGDGGFTPHEAAKMLVAIYGHPRWSPTGLEAQALMVARAFLGYGVALRSIAQNTCCDGCQEAARVASTALSKSCTPDGDGVTR